jgi:glycosyltransferase involved in cell wall biosynthesis
MAVGSSIPGDRISSRLILQCLRSCCQNVVKTIWHPIFHHRPSRRYPWWVPEKTGGWFRYLYPFTKKIWKEAEKIVTVSHFTSHLAEISYPGIHPQVIFNGVDTSVIKPQSYEIHNPPRIIFAGRFMEQKNPLLFIEVLNKLKSLSWDCVMMGDGPLKPLVEEKIQDYGMQERFTLPGWISPEEVIETYQRGDIFFMPSRSEGLPVAGVQAIAMDWRL